MNYVFLDFESAYDKKAGYYMGSKALSTYEYVRDARFKAFGFSWIHGNSETPTWVTAKDAKWALDQIDWSDTAVIGHNVKFDGFILKERYGIQPKLWIDTLAISRAVLGRTVKGHALKELAEHFGLPPKMDTLKEFDGKWELTAEEEARLAEYCKHDTWLCREIYKRLAPEFPKNQYAVMSWTIDTYVNPKLVLNVPLLEKAAEEEAAEKKAKYERLGLDGSIFRSTAKFAALLTEKGYKVPYKKNKKGKDIPALAKGDVAFLEMLEDETDEQLKLLCEAREAAKSTTVETRSGRLARIGRTGLWAFDLGFSAAMNTHRFAGEGGTNAQNFRKCRDKKAHAEPGHRCPGIILYCIGAKDGFSIVVGDASQIEARYTGYLSGDPGLINEIENRPDIYCDFGTDFFKRTITKADQIERQFSKVAKLSLQYGTGGEKLQVSCKTQADQDVPLEKCQEAVRLYRMKYPKVPALWRTLESYIPKMAAGETGQVGFLPIRYGKDYLELPSGLKIRYPNLRQGERTDKRGRTRTEWMYDVYKNKRLETSNLYGAKMLEGICQALTGEHIKTVMEDFLDVAVGQEHDAIFLLVPTVLAPIYAAKLNAAISVKPKWMDRIKLAAETSWGKTWAECKQ